MNEQQFYCGLILAIFIPTVIVLLAIFIKICNSDFGYTRTIDLNFKNKKNAKRTKKTRRIVR